MAYPSVAATAETNFTTASNTRILTLPTTSAGQLLIGFLGHQRNATSTTSVSDSATDSWTQIVDSTTAEGFASLDIWAKVATGAESGGTVTFTLTGTASATAGGTVWAIDNVRDGISSIDAGSLTGNIIEDASAAVTTLVTPPSDTAPWGVKENLFISCAAINTGTSAAMTTYPYADNNILELGDPGSGAVCGIGICSDELNVASANPDSFVINKTSSYVTVTLIVEGAEIARDNFTIATGSVVSGGTTAHTVAAGSNRALLAFITQEASTDISAVTYGTQSLTKLQDISHSAQSANRIEVWWLNEAGLAAASNSNLIVTGPTCYRNVWSGSNIAQTIQDSDSAEDAASTTTVSGTLTATAGSLLVALGYTNDDRTYTAVTGQSLLGESPVGVTALSYGMYEKPVDANSTITAQTGSAPTRSLIGAVSLQPYSEPTFQAAWAKNSTQVIQ